MLYKLGFDWKLSELELRGENPRFWMKIVQEGDTGRPGARATVAFFVIFERVRFGVFLIGIL